MVKTISFHYIITCFCLIVLIIIPFITRIISNAHVSRSIHTWDMPPSFIFVWSNAT